MPELMQLGAGMALTGFNNLLSSGMGSTSRYENYKYGEMAAENAMMRNKSMYQDLYSPAAKMKQIKEAGLSPSLMAEGMAGGGGFSGAPQGNGAAGISNQFVPMSALEMAQIQNINADTRVKNAEADTKTGENERGMAEIANLWQNAQYTKAATALKEQETVQQQWQNYITSQSAESTINTLYANAELTSNAALKSTYEIISAEAQAKVDEATINARIEQAEKNAQYTEAQTLLAKSGIKLNEAETEKAQQQIKQIQEQIKIAWKDLYNEIYKASTDRARWRTYDQFVETQCRTMRDEFNWNQDLQQRKFMESIIMDATNTTLNAINAATPVPKKR